jgi:hypothetical protein
MLAREGYFVLELGYNLPQYGQIPVYDRPSFQLEYIEEAISRVLAHPKVYGEGFKNIYVKVSTLYIHNIFESS